MIIPENNHANNILPMEQLVFGKTHAYTCTYTHKIANNVKRDNRLEKEQEGVYGNIGGKKGTDDVIKLFSQQINM